MASLKQQIEKLPTWSKEDWEGRWVNRKFVRLDAVLGLLVDCVCIPRKQLEEKLGVCVGERAKNCRRLDHALIRELLELGDEK